MDGCLRKSAENQCAKTEIGRKRECAEEDWFQVACTYDFSSGEEAVQTTIKEVLHFLSETTDLLIEIDLPF